MAKAWRYTLAGMLTVIGFFPCLLFVNWLTPRINPWITTHLGQSIDQNIAITIAGIMAVAFVGTPLTVWAANATLSGAKRAVLDALPDSRRGQLPIVAEVARTVADGTRADMLGIQDAIPLTTDTDPSLSPTLPTYVPRDSDSTLRSQLTNAAAHGGFLLLVGTSAAGKTRSALQGLQATVPKWRLLIPANGTQLNNLVNAGFNFNKTVIWLDELHRYLQGPNKIEPATIKRLLASRQRVIVIGTIWPENRDHLLAQPAAGTADINADARHILRQIPNTNIINVPVVFSPAERRRAAATVDPRINEALATDHTGHLTQTLAAVPDMVNKWRTGRDPHLGPNSYGQAILTAAIVCRQAGHPEPLPTELLQAVAADLLTDAQRGAAGPDWATAAFAWASHPVRGSATCLHPVAKIIGRIDGYRLADPVLQDANRDPNPPATRLSDPLFDRLVDLASVDARLALGHSAWTGGRLAGAEYAFRKLAVTDHLMGQARLGELLMTTGRQGEAEEWLRRSAAAGHPIGMGNLGRLLTITDRKAEAEDWLRKSAATGEPEGQARLGELLMTTGRQDQAEEWLRKSATAGQPVGMANLGALLARTGRLEEAEPWLRGSADTGEVHGMAILGYLLINTCRIEEAERWLRKASEVGQWVGMAYLGYLLQCTDRQAEAEEWLRRSAEGAGHPAGMAFLGYFLQCADRQAEAEEWLYKSAAAGHPLGKAYLGKLLIDTERGPDGEKWLRESADAGQPIGMAYYGALLAATGREREAEGWLRRSAATRQPVGMAELSKLLVASNRKREGEKWRKRAVAACHPAGL